MTSEAQIKAVLAKHIKPWEMDGFPCVTGIPEAAAEIAALASTAGAGAGDWRPIETAPRDGTWFLGWQRLGGELAHKPANVVRWHEGAWTLWASSDVRHPTHWMPLPSAPGQSPAVPASTRSGPETASPPAPAEHGVEIRKANDQSIEGCILCCNGADLPQGEYCRACGRTRKTGSLLDALNKVEGRNAPPTTKVAFAACPQAVISAFSQGGGAGRSERAVEIAYEVDERGAWTWLVWAVQSTGAQLAAIASTEEKAEGYRGPVAQLYPGARFFTERAPVNHTFGGDDLRSVAWRAAMKSVRDGRKAITPDPAQSPSTSDAEG